MLERIKNALYHLTRWGAWLGMGFLLAAMVITTTDVVLRKINGRGIYGTVDLVQLMIMGAAYLSIPYGFMTRSHVSVSVIVDNFNRRSTALTNFLAAVLATGFMGAVAWFGFEQTLMQIEYGDISLTLGVPKIYYWIPLLAGSALSAVVCLYLAVEALHVAFTGRSSLTPKTNQGEG